MKLLDLYKWIAGSQSDFTRDFKDNEALFSQARAFWKNLESSSLIIVILLFVVGLSLAYIYYQPYNNAPGRHYRPSYWLAFLALVFISTLLLTCGYEYAVVKPVLDGAMFLEFKIALGNAAYASVLYLITSVVWCNSLPTNACRIFKIGY